MLLVNVCESRSGARKGGFGGGRLLDITTCLLWVWIHGFHVVKLFHGRGTILSPQRATQRALEAKSKPFLLSVEPIKMDFYGWGGGERRGVRGPHPG